MLKVFALSHEKNAVADAQFEQQLEQKLWPQLALSIDINNKKKKNHSFGM